MTFIEKVTLKNFKSFGNRTITLRLSEGLNSISAPKNTGKSNLIDVFRFFLGRYTVNKDASKMSEGLIYRDQHGKSKSKSASVTLTFNNDDLSIAGYKPSINITRTITRDNIEHYTINKKRVNYEEFNNTLKFTNLDNKSNNPFIIQKAFSQFTEQKPEERLIAILELIESQKSKASCYFIDDFDQLLENLSDISIIRLVKELATFSQFLVVSNNKQVFLNANRSYGLSMQSRGITDIFSLNINTDSDLEYLLEYFNR